MSNKFQPVEFKPGQLITNAAPETVGLSNWTVKRDWRRILDRECRREGEMEFGNPDERLTTGDEITLIHTCRRPNGQTALIAATPTALFRYNEAGAGSYFLEDYASEDYSYVSTEAWVMVASGFSQYAHRWEAVNINGYAVLNNGVDLPFTYRIEDDAIRPIYELRDAGIASVGTICEWNTSLVCFDISQIKDEYFNDLMQSEGRYGVFAEANKFDRYQYRIVPSMPLEPRRFAASVPATLRYGSTLMTFKWANKSFEVGQKVVITGAGADGGNLIATINNIENDGVNVTLDTPCLYQEDGQPATLVDTDVQAYDSIGSMVGYYDLEDDGSAIRRAMPLRDRLVVYKDTSIFIGTFTGQAASPYVFERVYEGKDSLFHRWTLINVQSSSDYPPFHLYGGRGGLFKFDFSSRNPVRFGTEVENTFLNGVSDQDKELVFSADNALTKEIFICFPSFDNSKDNALCIDYKYNTISTTSASYTAAAAIIKPQPGIQSSPENWFALGARGSDLTYCLRRYGINENGTPICFDRVGEDYECVLRSGAGYAGSSMNTTMINGYMVKLASGGSLEMSVYKVDWVNSQQANTLVFTREQGATGIAPIYTPCGFIADLVLDEIKVSEQGVNAQVISRSYMAKELQTWGAGKC